MIDAIAGAAASGARCPSDSELARLLPPGANVRRLLRGMVAAGTIRILLSQDGRRVEIVATGAITAWPAGRRRPEPPTLMDKAPRIFLTALDPDEPGDGSGNRWMDDARQGSEALLRALRASGVAG